MTRADLARLTYPAYLASAYWLRQRRATLERDDYACVVCNSPHDLNIHHRRYRGRGAEKPGDLCCAPRVIVCSPRRGVCRAT